MNPGFNEEPIINLPVGGRAFVRRKDIQEHTTGGFFVSAAAPMSEMGGADFYAVTRISDYLLQVKLSLFAAPCVLIER